MTRKELLTFGKTYQASYASLQFLLDPLTAHKVGYNHGIYGWNWTAYRFETFCINTGYRNLCGTRIPYDLEQKYNSLGRLAAIKYSFPERVRLNLKLISRLIRETERKGA